jgi:hypothetical protein
MTSDLASLLERAAASPLGPLSLACRPEENGWGLTVNFGSRPGVSVKATRDAAGGGLCLYRRVLAGAASDLRDAQARPWVVEVDTTFADVVGVRLWLHGDGLDLNTLFAALAYMARLGDVADEADSEARRAQVAATPLTEPEPMVVVPVRQQSWQSFASAGADAAESGRSEQAVDPPAPVPVVSAAEAEEDAMPAPETATPQPDSEIAAAVDNGGQALITEGASEPLTAALETAAQESPVAVEAGASATAAPAEVTSLPQPMGISGTCRECGSPYRQDHAFCTTCGARLT